MCPISGIKMHLAAILFVDDTDILHIQLEESEIVEETFQALQASINSWCSLLIASRGAFKSETCFTYLISFQWNVKEMWDYDVNHELQQFGYSVSMPNECHQSISHLPVTEAKETLGVCLCLTGEATASLLALKEKA